MTPLFVGVNARCRHSIPISPEVDGCVICEWENEILASTPPFDVECIEDQGCSLNKGDHYIVVAIIKDGAAAWGDKDSIPGVLLRGKDDMAFPRLYRVSRFNLLKEKKS